jgi:hypothetical protein
MTDEKIAADTSVENMQRDTLLSENTDNASAEEGTSEEAQDAIKTQRQKKHNKKRSTDKKSGLFSIFRKKKKGSDESSNTEDGTPDDGSEDTFPKEPGSDDKGYDIEEQTPKYRADYVGFVKKSCVDSNELEKEIMNLEMCFNDVTEYLTDIQKISRIEDDDFKELKDAAGSLDALLRERIRFQNRKLKVTESQIRRFDQYSSKELESQIDRMEAAESYMDDIKSDIGNLKHEKKILKKEFEEIRSRQQSLRTIAKLLSIMLAGILLVLGILYASVTSALEIPFILTIAFTAAFAVVIFTESRKNQADAILNERKANKAAGLLNTVKIKYVNTKNMLDFNHEKYGVTDSDDFKKTYSDYLQEKEYEKEYFNNSEKVSGAAERLIELLKGYDLADPGRWASEPQYIADEAEMTDLRHSLNEQRGELRKKILKAKETDEELLQRINRIIEDHPELNDEFQEIFKKMYAT